MLKIRLKRIGKKNDPQYRIVIMPARSKRDGKALEYIGYYNPRKKETKLNTKRAEYWLSIGAKPTDTARSILVKQKLLKQQPRPKRLPKKPKKEKDIKKEPKSNQPKTQSNKAKDKSQTKEKKDEKKILKEKK